MAEVQVQQDNHDPCGTHTGQMPTERKQVFAPAQRREGRRVGDPGFGDGGTTSLPNHHFADGIQFRCGGLMFLKQNFTRCFHGLFVFSRTNLRKARLAWYIRDFTVPSGVLVMRAISSSEKSSTKCSSNTARCDSGKWSSKFINSASCSRRMSKWSGPLSNSSGDSAISPERAASRSCFR